MRLRSVMGGATAGVALATVLAACGGSGGKDGATSAAGAAAGTPASQTAQNDSGYGYGSGTTTGSGGGGTAVTVDETEFRLALSTTTFSPGRYTFTAKNTGHATHDLVIEGPGIEEQKSSSIGPGGATSMTVTLQKGTYELYCAIANHKNLGMKTEIKVG